MEKVFQGTTDSLNVLLSGDLFHFCSTEGELIVKDETITRLPFTAAILIIDHTFKDCIIVDNTAFQQVCTT